jgi:glutathione S-transferase
LGSAVSIFLWFTRNQHSSSSSPRHIAPEDDEQLLKNVDNPAIKNAYLSLRSEREELKEQLKETHKRSTRVINEIHAEREELLHQLLDKDRFTLTYFDARGRAEQIRLLLAECGANYTDLRVSKETWEKTELREKTPLGVLPILEHNGRIIGESIAIMVYLAKIYERWPTKPDTEAAALMILTATDDVRRVADSVKFAQDPEQKDINAKKLLRFLEDRLPHFEKLLEQDGFFTSGRITAADISFWDLLEQITEQSASFAEVISKFKQIDSFRKRILTLPRIVRYLQARK